MSGIRSIRDIWHRKGHVLNGYITLGGAASAELYCHQGWDSVTLDMEHGAIGFDAAVDLLRAMAASGVVPLARVPKGDPTWVSTLLDAGMMGITAAMIETPEEAQRLVQACRYPPEGTRGMSRQCRAALLHGPDYTAQANSLVSVFAMVETHTALAQLEAIAAVPGLDGLYFGGVDYEMSLRSLSPEQAAKTPTVQAARHAIVQACQRHGILAGMNANSPAAAGELIAQGFRFITLSSDAQALSTQARAWVNQTRALFDQPR